MMKLFNFRPLCWLALIVILAIGSAMLAWWCAVVYCVLLFSILLWSKKLPREFKIVVACLYVLTMLSYMLTTCFVSNPYYLSYNPDEGLRGIILRYARSFLSSFLSETNTDIVYTMLFGDKSVLAFGVRYDFTVSGMAHILVVSGLHVSALFGAVKTILSWCRVPKRIHLWVIAPVLCFYGYLCGWQYSIIRAVIMCLVYSLAKHHLRLADSLSVLSLAATVILVIYPYVLVSASFLLSFSCVLGIYLWYQTVLRVCPSSTVAMYVAVTLGSFPFIVYFFGSVPLLGIVANVILVPLLMFAFYLSLFAVCTFIGSFVLWIVEPVLNFVTWVTSAIGQIPWATLPITHGLGAIFVYYMATLLLSRYVFVKPQIKYPLVILLFTCYLTSIMV